jgi:hypothetical protein
VLEDGAAGVAVGEDGEEAHGAAAGVADEDVDHKYTIHQRGPGEPTEWAGANAGDILLRSGGVRCNDRGAELVVGREHGHHASVLKNCHASWVEFAYAGAANACQQTGASAAGEIQSCRS